MTIEERLEALERENRELKEMLGKVALIASYAYEGMNLDRSSTIDTEVMMFAQLCLSR